MLTGRTLARYLGAGLLGVVVGVVGTGVHRAERPWGLVLALLTVVVAAVLVRAWTGGAGLLALGLGVVTVVGLLGGPGPGGDVVVALDPYGVVWYAGAVLVAVAAVLPRRWFSDRPTGA